VEIKFVRNAKECTTNKIKNKAVQKELHIYLVNGRRDDYREKWLTHPNREECNRLQHLHFITNTRGIWRPLL
jgi:hypothetical protein